jgi:hypothetical protein
MNLKITLTVDPDGGEQLVGLLAKALGRGELGIHGLQIEQVLPYHREHVEPPKQSVIAKLVAKRPASAKVFEAARARSAKAFLGMRALQQGKPNSMTITMRALKREASRDGIQAMLKAHGFNPNGLSPTLSKLRKRGYAKNVGLGVWRLTPKGEELEARLNEKVEHDDSKND